MSRSSINNKSKVSAKHRGLKKKTGKYCTVHDVPNKEFVQGSQCHIKKCVVYYY